MTTLEQYRRCFEACGITLPEGTGIQWMDGYSAFLERAGGPELGQHESLCVCRFAAEDWLRREEGSSIELLCENPDGDGAIIVTAEFLGGEWETRRIAGESIHDRLIAACYAAAGREPT